MMFICKRCNQEFSVKSHLKAHLMRKKICKFIENDLDRDKLLKELYERNLNEKTHVCTYCYKKFNTKSSRYRHQKICKKK